MSPRWLTGLQIFFIVAMIAGVLGHKGGVIDFQMLSVGFGTSLLGLLCIGLISLGVLPVAAFKRKGRVAKHALAALGIAAVPPAIMIITVGMANLQVPPIHDITTDLDDVPSFKAVQQYRDATDNSLEYAGEAVASQQQDHYTDLKPLLLPVSPDQAFQQAKAAVERLGWEVVRADMELLELEAVEATELFGFKDDVIVRVRAAEQGSRIDVRSVSRVGRSDLGANAQRIRRLFAEIQR